MTTIVLVRHGRSVANADGVLAGRADGVTLDDVGRKQAYDLGELFQGITVAAAYRSPILRCEQTATLMGFGDAVVDEGLTECDYGAWTNRSLTELAGEEAWATIQARPSEVTFPDGESMLAMRDRAVEAVTAIAQRHAKGDVVVVVSHGDPIKAMLAHALGTPFDEFQRINVGPASLSVVDFSGERPFVVCVNSGVDVRGLLGAKHEAVVGGGDVAAE